MAKKNKKQSAKQAFNKKQSSFNSETYKANIAIATPAGAVGFTPGMSPSDGWLELFFGGFVISTGGATKINHYLSLSTADKVAALDAYAVMFVLNAMGRSIDEVVPNKYNSVSVNYAKSWMEDTNAWTIQKETNGFDVEFALNLWEQKFDQYGISTDELRRYLLNETPLQTGDDVFVNRNIPYGMRIGVFTGTPEEFQAHLNSMMN